MGTIDSSMQNLTDALEALEEELARKVGSNADDRDFAIAAARHARTARISTQTAAKELSSVIADLKDIIAAANTDDASSK